MNKITMIESVTKFSFYKNDFAYKRGGDLYLEDKKIGDAYDFVCSDNFILLKKTETGFLYKYNNEEIELVVEKNFYLESYKKISDSLYYIVEYSPDNSQQLDAYTFDEKLSFTKTGLTYKDIAAGKFILYNQKVLIVKDFFNAILWQKKSDDYNTLTTNKDELKFDPGPFGSKENIYIPISTGDLIALNSKDGSILWHKVYKTQAETEITNGFYAALDNYIYRHDIYSLAKINATTGEIEKVVVFEDVKELQNINKYPEGEKLDKRMRAFNAYSPILVNEDKIVVWSGREAQVVVFNSESLSYHTHLKIENSSGIAFSNDVVKWNNNKLYVLDMNRRLHIFEEE